MYRDQRPVYHPEVYQKKNTGPSILGDDSVFHYFEELCPSRTLIGNNILPLIYLFLLQNSVNLRHGSLVYWLQHPAENKHSPKPLEGYLFTRSFNPSAWRRKTDRWVQKYFMLDRSKLYQFTDSTCRGAEFQLNIK